MESPLGAVDPDTKSVAKVDWCRLEGTQATGRVGFLGPWILLVPVTPGGFVTDIAFYSQLILMLNSFCSRAFRCMRDP